MARVLAQTVCEATLRSDRVYDDPFNQVELDVVVSGPAGEQRVPAFWAGEHLWRFRWSGEPGTYAWRSVCSDTDNDGLHGVEGELEVLPHESTNPLIAHGPIRVAADRRHLEHADGTPFCWLGDTWWMGLCARLRWPDEWRMLVDDRVAKGFSLIQIVAGLYPDMGAFDERGVNEAGFAWTRDWSRIEPAYFDHADRRIFDLVDHGLVPCIVGAWGYYLPWTGVARMKQHWRNLVARWGALPVVWCLAGEGAMPYYLTEHRDAEIAEQKAGWTEVARYVRQIDPFGRPIGIHPTTVGRDQVEDPTVLDLDLLQTGHADRASLVPTIRTVRESCAREPAMPVIESEVCYEGIGEACRQEVQRLMFWAAWLSGARGYTYGANGIWQVNRAGAPYGPSPHGMAWGDVPWDEAMHLPGSGQLGLARRILERFEWWRLEPLPDGCEPRTGDGHWEAPLCAKLGEDLRLAYLPPTMVWRTFKLTGLPPGSRWTGTLVSPLDGTEYDAGTAPVADDGTWTWTLARLPLFQDWLLVARAEAGA